MNDAHNDIKLLLAKAPEYPSTVILPANAPQYLIDAFTAGGFTVVLQQPISGDDKPSQKEATQ